MAKLTELAKKLIDGKNLANVATLMPDGSPQVASVWVEREGDTVVINATTTRQRYRNLKRDPRVALCVFDQDNIYTTVMIRGRATEITLEGAEEDIDRLSMKYNGRKYPDHSPERPRVIIRIAPEHVTEWNGRRYNAARDRSPSHQDTDVSSQRGRT
jgi:PPOX class probable F420-dependent enzyme